MQPQGFKHLDRGKNTANMFAFQRFSYKCYDKMRLERNDFRISVCILETVLEERELKTILHLRDNLEEMGLVKFVSRLIRYIFSRIPGLSWVFYGILFQSV